VSSLSGSAGIESGDGETLRDGRVVVSTPEKLDFTLRNDPILIDDIGLIVLDEGHMRGCGGRTSARSDTRRWFNVQLVARMLPTGASYSSRLSSLTPEEMSDLAAWLRDDEPGEPIHSSWRPTTGTSSS